VAGEGEVDDAGNRIAEEKDIVVEEIGVDHALRQVLRPHPTFEIIELARDEIAQARLHAVGTISGAIEQRPPARYRQRIGARYCEIAPGEMHFRQRSTDAGAMRGVRLARPDAFEKGD